MTLRVPDPTDDATTAQRLARLLRHEMGDLLQSVYATVAILLDRLPEPLALERQLLGELKSRAEMSKLELDGVVDLVCPGSTITGTLHLDSVLETVFAQVTPRFPHLHIARSSEPDLVIIANLRLFNAAMLFLVLGMCQAARKSVALRLRCDGGAIRCEIDRDGYPVTAEQAQWLTRPFATTQQANFGLALALLQKASGPAAGQISLSNQPGGGVQVLLVFPPSPANSAS